jgi:hypothetical protein
MSPAESDMESPIPPRGKAPGLKRGRVLKDGTALWYWMARQVVTDPMGFPDSCIPLPRGVDMEALAEICHGHTKRLMIWIEKCRREPERPDLPRYDGTVLSACQIYQRHPQSRFHKVKRNTRKSYADSLKVIESTQGPRLIGRLTIVDIDQWYDEWRAPAAPGGPDRVDRGHNAVAMFRTVLRFCAALRLPGCKILADELALVKFEKGGARQEEMTYQHACAFIKKSLELGEAGVIPKDRGLYMALGTAAQFETLLRQKDIIGEWNGDEWSGFFAWEYIPGWRWRMKTSKSKYRAAAAFDLKNYPLLFPLLDAVPHAERTGAIVKGEHGLPVRERSYRKWFREIARAAGIPDEVWNMDTRAGGATEAEEAGAAVEAIQSAMTHSKKDTTLRYIRTRETKIAAVADARAKKRASEDQE